MHEFLSKVSLLSGLPPEDLEKLSKEVTHHHLKGGDLLFEEGAPGDACYIILEGALTVTKRSGEHDVLLAERVPGEVLGEMALLDNAPRTATVRAREDCHLIGIGKDAFDQLLYTSAGAALAMLHTFTTRLREMQSALHHSEKMAALGTMTAGAAHELNNPAAAARRASGQLGETLTRLHHAGREVEALGLNSDRRKTLDSLRDDLVSRAASPVYLDTIARSDRESEVETWLDEHDVTEGWELAPPLVSAGYASGDLEVIAGQFEADHLPAILRWLAVTYAARGLLEEINHSAGRISDIVRAMKQYAYLDQAAVQEVDIHEGLDNSLIMLHHKIKDGVTVIRDYAPDLPKITAYASELPQVWTNLIDNAVDAMKGSGELRIQTRHEDDHVVVAITDNGPGIPPEIQPRVFDTFFTTKAPGAGTGLGLHISYTIIEKHHGQIRLTSRPGETTFEVSLPLAGPSK